MTPKEKANELVEKHLKSYDIEDIAIKSALITVDEILDEHRFDDSDYANRRIKYYQEVKQEIENL